MQNVCVCVCVFLYIFLFRFVSPLLSFPLDSVPLQDMIVLSVFKRASLYIPSLFRETATGSPNEIGLPYVKDDALNPS